MLKILKKHLQKTENWKWNHSSGTCLKVVSKRFWYKGVAPGDY